MTRQPTRFPPAIRRCCTVAVAGLLLATGVVQAGCLPLADESKIAAARSARVHGLEPIRFPTRTFLLQGYGTPAAKGPVLTVYIEGDGVTRQVDPTPGAQTALQLAAADPRRPILYLGRPCQYVADLDPVNCTGVGAASNWRMARYSERVVVAIEQAIADMMRRTGASRLVLTGYSGGGVLAALVAGRRYFRGRRDVDVLVTVAAPLDHKAWTAHHDTSELSGSEDPLTYVESLRLVPQIHFSGALDDIVPHTVVRSYIDKLGLNPRVRHVVFVDQDHASWPSAWHEALGFVHAPYQP